MISGNLPGYAELHCVTNFSFLRGASHGEELVERAAALGYAALAITDECSLAGVVRAHVEAKEQRAASDHRQRNPSADCRVGEPYAAGAAAQPIALATATCRN